MRIENPSLCPTEGSLHFIPCASQALAASPGGGTGTLEEEFPDLGVEELAVVLEAAPPLDV